MASQSILSFTLVLGGLVVGASAWAAQPLLAPAELAASLKSPQVRVIDIREAKDFAAQHIAGAVSAPYGSWRGPAGNPGELPELSKLAALVQGLGITPEQHLVLVSSGADATDFGATARVYWTLKVLGLKELSILNGGLKAWSQAGLPLGQQPGKPMPSQFQPRLDTSLMATKAEVVQRVNAGGANLVDARPAEFYLGETRHQAAKLPGTLKGAVNVEHSKWFAPGSSAMVSGDVAKTVFTTASLNPQQETVSFCNTGHWAATNWFAMSELLGQKQVKLYAGSMVEWTQDQSALPMANVPSRDKQLVIDAKLWLARTAK